MNHFVLSVNPEYTKLIFDGTKCCEFRKRIPKLMSPGDTLWIYETKNKGGVGKVIGKATVKSIDDIRSAKDGIVEHVFEDWKTENSIEYNMEWYTNDAFMNYFESIGGCSGFVFSINIDNIETITPLDISCFAKNSVSLKRPPQSIQQIDCPDI